MIKGILGKKLGMSQVFGPGGELIPVTLIEAGPCYVIQVKDEKSDGYSAVQLGFCQKKESRVNKPLRGHQDKAGKGYFYFLREIRDEDASSVKVGDEISIADVFNKGDVLSVTGTSKGKGFQGAVKRHGFGGLPAGHGSLIHRATGSIGASAYPGKVIKGKRMPGHMGNRKVTVRGLEVVDVKADKNILLVKGPVPGAKGQLVILRKQGV
ncbi:MAG: 50S ribosomal protein L3 [Deltaproteobacteria bacterium]|nr:50S ribosomal protein L3 [Deltaproteobacteria bacterium]